MSDDPSGSDHVQVAAPPGREDEARRFYGELLGLEEIPKPPLLVPARGRLVPRRRARAARRRRRGLHAGGEGTPGVARRLAGGAGRDRSRLEATGVDVAWADPAEIPGTSRFHVHDPWGNRLELVARDEAGTNP